MTSESTDDISVGKYQGRLAENYHFPEFLSWAQDMERLVAQVLSGGATGAPARNRNVRLVFSRGGASVALAVKAFGRQPAIKDWMDTFKGSRARRSWAAASYLRDHNVGTPSPVGFLERWENGRLAESYFLAEYQDPITSFKDELIRLFHDDPDCEKFMALIQCVAEAVRAMHETGFQHNDLGNQNILLKRLDEKRWGGVQFIDLNRARIREPLTIGARARDISRINLPSDFMRIFEDMYYGDAVPPHKFREAQRFSRRLYAWHANTRKWRHPIRTAQIREAEKGLRTYPWEKDMWVWDWRSAQAISVMRPKDRSRFYSHRHFMQILRATGAGFIPTWRRYEELLDAAYRSPVVMKDRVGMTLTVNSATLGRELEALRNLGKLPVLVRIHQHDPSDAWMLAARVVKDLAREGYPMSIALIQDRRSVTEPDRWRSFVAAVLEQVHGAVEWVEVGHAINRVKWGIWDLGEHRRLMEIMVEMAGRFPDVKFMGPAVIDFEYLHLMAALKNLPPSWRFGALSHLLYVDRRGAPESQQGMFDALDKFAQAKAVALWSGVCGDRVIVSEVNWPLKGTGVFSPVGAPHASPGPRHDDPSVTEDEYGDYMLRYLLIAICSGLIDRVYWWRLVARGFGLVDDTDERRWRERPAFHMLKTFLSTLGECTFRRKPDAREGLAPQDLPRAEGVHCFVFQRPDGREVSVAYSSSGPVDLVLPFEYEQVRDAFGKPLAAKPDRRTVTLSGRPVYILAS
jgi:hypothetical protein